MIAVSRSLGRVLPEDARLIHDPFGERFATPFLRFVANNATWLLPVIESTLATVQVRTRLIDEALISFLEQGGSQVLLLGAGYDARAARFAERLGDARVFEIDHPATQADKRARLPDPASVHYLPWDFERSPVAELPAALAALGHEPTRPTLTIWEGVTMYLSEPAVDTTARAIAALSAPGSRFVFTYVERGALERPGFVYRLVAKLVSFVGEPLRFGFEPSELPSWTASRGFTLEHDVSFHDAAELLLPARLAAQVERRMRVAFATRAQ
ncbi:MAG: class I SAM-dependent methyltransferase [Deltaproteobacteria bacterium]|nr:class I SAM-dependent methyltransferase [Deltaproteobacteria bacterium]